MTHGVVVARCFVHGGHPCARIVISNQLDLLIGIGKENIYAHLLRVHPALDRPLHVVAHRAVVRAPAAVPALGARLLELGAGSRHRGVTVCTKTLLVEFLLQALVGIGVLHYFLPFIYLLPLLVYFPNYLVHWPHHVDVWNLPED